MRWCPFEFCTNLFDSCSCILNATSARCVPHEGVTEGKLTVGDCNATLSTEYPICTDLGLDPDMRGERPRLVTEPEKREKTGFDSMSYSVDWGTANRRRATAGWTI